MPALRRVVIALVLTAVFAGVVVGALWGGALVNREPAPFLDRCVADVAGQTVGLELEQARNASIIAGVATQRSLVPRAATIGLATAYQESGLRNLDHGDRDSLGLFQQRPSQGWGTPAQVMDPWYAANAFYAALVKVPGWESGDVNDVAQAVQRSGHPDAYAKHVEKARRIASALSGETPASFTCLDRTPRAADPDGLVDFLSRTVPSGLTVTRAGSGVRIGAPNERAAWSAAHLVVANAGAFGVRGITVGGATWESAVVLLPAWRGTSGGARSVDVSFD